MRETDLWLRGGFPRAFLAPDAEASHAWRLEFIRTYLERDLPRLGINIASGTLRRFWTMVAHSHGQIWNGSRLAASLGVAHTTARSYLDVLCDTFIARQLPPYLASIGNGRSNHQRSTCATRDCCMRFWGSGTTTSWPAIPYWERHGRGSPWSR